MCPEWNTSEDNIQEPKDIEVDKDKYPTVSKYIKD
jgi:hypothetical protein